jgi:GMP synthase-like glutamine amidotransferase
MRIHYLQHVPFEDPAGIFDWAATRGHTMSGTRLFDQHALPRPDSFDLLVVMGGPMGVSDVDEHPWLADEKRFLAAAFDAGAKAVGICLGAQLLAEALGARVYRHTCKEIGWFDVQRTPASAWCPLFDGLPEHFTAFHWHGDTFDLPAGAIHLAASAACASQAFSYEGRVIGLQFHLESTLESIARLCAHCSEELAAGPYIQSADAMFAAAERGCAATAPLMGRILDALV